MAEPAPRRPAAGCARAGHRSPRRKIHPERVFIRARPRRTPVNSRARERRAAPPCTPGPAWPSRGDSREVRTPVPWMGCAAQETEGAPAAAEQGWPGGRGGAGTLLVTERRSATTPAHRRCARRPGRRSGRLSGRSRAVQGGRRPCVRARRPLVPDCAPRTRPPRRTPAAGSCFGMSGGGASCLPPAATFRIWNPAVCPWLAASGTLTACGVPSGCPPQSAGPCPSGPPQPTASLPAPLPAAWGPLLRDSWPGLSLRP